jgi:hypothetical protein
MHRSKATISPPKRTMNNIKKTANAHKISSKASFITRKNVATNTCSKIYIERMRARERSGRDLGSINLI